MRFVIQRVSHASVSAEGRILGKIGRGFLVLIGVSDTDTKETADKMVKKMLKFFCKISCREWILLNILISFSPIFPAISIAVIFTS